MGPEARLLLQTFLLDAQSLASYQVVAPVSQSTLCARQTSSTVVAVPQTFQLPNKSGDTYYAELCMMVKRCSYPSAAVEERLVRDRFVAGRCDYCLSDHLCRNAKLRLKEAWTQARQSEDDDKEKASSQDSTEHSRKLNLDATKANKITSRCCCGAKPTTPQPQAERSREPYTCEFLWPCASPTFRLPYPTLCLQLLHKENVLCRSMSLAEVQAAVCNELLFHISYSVLAAISAP